MTSIVDNSDDVFGESDEVRDPRYLDLSRLKYYAVAAYDKPTPRPFTR